ncbi:MAG: DUF3575 domain-containing protein [Cytophagia bacterium]|nr:MAG: DUF3575 domain-containing protein [Cytophagales bacterium]TAG38391.1 MAG: DUF3575 domain-containing protein [Cytophagia bacterium]
MKKKYIFIFLLLFPLINQLSAQDQPQKNYKSNARLNLLSLFVGRFSAQYEYQFKQNSINLNYNLSFNDNKLGYAAGLSYRYYFSDKRSAFFVGGIANYSDYSEVVNTKDLLNLYQNFRLRGKCITIAPNAGFRWNILRIFNITGRFGVGVPFVTDFSWQTPTTLPNEDNQNNLKTSFKLNAAFDGELSFGIRF